MFGDEKSRYGGLDDIINTYMKGDDSFYTDGLKMNDASLDYAMDVLGGYLKKEKSKPAKDNRSTRLQKGQPCPVCEHAISQETSAYGGREFTNKCQKCGLTDESSNWDAVHQLSLEEFRWEYETKKDAEKKASEEKTVIAIYRKIWSGVELTEQEEAELEAIALSQKEAIGV